MADRVKIFLLDINEESSKRITLNSVVSVAIVKEVASTGKIDVKVAKGKTLGNVIATVKAKIPSAEPASFKVMKDGYITGNGSMSLEHITRQGKAKAVAVAEVTRLGNNSEVVGYVLIDRSGKVACLNRKAVMEFYKKHSRTAVANLKLIEENNHSLAVAAKDKESLLKYVIGKQESNANKGEEKPADIKKVAAVDAQKADILKSVRGTKFAAIVGDKFGADEIKFLLFTHNRRRKIKYLMNPAYKAEQMKVLQYFFERGVDIAKFSDPKLPAKEMWARGYAVEAGMWDTVADIELIK